MAHNNMQGGFVGNGMPMMYPGLNQGYSNVPAWSDQYTGNGMNGANAGYYPPHCPHPQSMYNNIGDQYGQTYGQQYQGGMGPVPSVPVPVASYGNHYMQTGPTSFNQFGNPVQYHEAQSFINPVGNTDAAGDDDAHLAPPGTESQSLPETNSNYSKHPYRPNNVVEKVSRNPVSKRSDSEGDLKHKTDPNLTIMEGFVTIACNGYGFMGPDVFFPTSSVRGNIIPDVGDYVLIEAEKAEGMDKYKYVGKRVQVLKLGSPNTTAQLRAEKLRELPVDMTGPAAEPESAPPHPGLNILLRNPPPPPILSKLSKPSAKKSRSRSRDRRYRDRSRSPISQHRSRHRRGRSSSRSKTPDRDPRRKRSRSRDSRDKDRRRERSRRSRSKSGSRRSPHRSKSNRSPEKQSTLNIKGLNLPIDIETILGDIQPKLADDTQELKHVELMKPTLSQQEFFKPTFIEIEDDQIPTDSKNKVNLLDYNIWGIPALPDIKPDKNSKYDLKDSNLMPAPSGSNATKSFKSKQISIKLGFMENKIKEEASRSQRKDHSPVVRYTEAAAKTKQDLFKDHVIGSFDVNEKIEIKIRNDLKMEDKHSNSSSRSRKHEKTSHRNDKDEQKEEKAREKVDRKKQVEFEKKVSDIAERRKKSPGGSSWRHSEKSAYSTSTSGSSRADKHKRGKSPPGHDHGRRCTSPKVSLVIPNERHRSPTPTEDEIMERERQIKLRELQLEEERILLERRLQRMSSGSRSPEIVLTSTSSSSRTKKLRSRSRSPRRRRRSYSRPRKSRSRSRSRGRPSQNERLVLDLGIRHSTGSSRLRDLDVNSSPEKGSGTSYRGQPLEHDAPVARRVRESSSPLPSRSRDDPSLVLRLGRILRNGQEFVCYVCRKKGHHGTVCWFRQPGVHYPEDDEPV